MTTRPATKKKGEGLRKGHDFIGTSVVFICHDGEGNFLLQKRGKKCRDEHEKWDCGGGGMEFGDTIEETLKKEIREEYCTDVLKYEFLGFRDVHRMHDGAPTHWIALDYRVLVDRKKVRNGEPHKLDEIGWYRINDLPKPQHSQFPHFLKLYKEKLV